MKRKIKKRMGMFFVFGMLAAGVLFSGNMQIQAAGKSLAELQAKFPGGKYWNHATQNGHDYNEATLVHSGNCNNPDGYTEHPCTGHTFDIQGEGYYDCNSYGGGLQCCGFAYKLADEVYGSMPNDWGITTIADAKAGDVIHFNTGDSFGHWAMIIGRNGTTVTLGECNYDYHCRIDWGRQCDLSGMSYTIYSAPGELPMGSSVVKPEPENRYDVEDNGDNTVTIIDGGFPSGDVVIPSEINGKKVTGIGERAFGNSWNMTSVVIPGSVVSIGEKAFVSCGMTTVTIQKGVKHIGKGAFDDCRSLESVIIPEGVTDIGDEAFYSCENMESVVISDSVASIGNAAFGYCRSLKSVIIPANVETIGFRAFICCDSLESVVFQNGVKDTGNGAFENCRNLKNVTIPKSMEIIGNYTFEGCTSLESVTLPDSITHIGQWSFRDAGLTGVTLPKSVTHIDIGAFCGCTNLKVVAIPGSVKTIDDDAFSGCISLENVVIPEGVRCLGDYAFRNCDSLSEVTIPGSLALDEDNYSFFGDVMGSAVFSDCDNLSRVILKEGVPCIGWYMFGDCASLKSVTIPGSVRYIDGKAFEGTKWLEDRKKENAPVIVNNNLIDASLCSGEVIIPEVVENISSAAFSGCNGLLSVTVPDSVTSIGNHEFWGCSSLKRVTVLGNRTDIYGGSIGYFDPGSFNWSGFYPKGSSKIDDFVICGRSGSKAEKYAKENGFEFQPIPDSGSSQGGSNPPVSCTHSYKISVIPATAKSNGSIVEKCSKCGNEKNRNVIYAADSIYLSKTSYTYSGKTYKPTVTAKDSCGRVLENNTDYTAAYPKDMKNVGRYTVTVTLKGSYSGTVKKTFDIVPKGTSISKITAKKKGFTVKWKKQASQTTGYEIVYSTNGKFSKKTTKIMDAGKSRATSKTVSRLKAKKKYYVRIRTYKTVKISGKSVKLYSKWSKAKAVTTKK